MPFADDLLEQAHDLALQEETNPKQEHRHTADYDNSKQWSRTDVANVLTLATDAFTAWRAIGAQDAAQDFLLQLFLPKLPKQ